MGKVLMHGYTQKSDDKNDLINKNMSIVKKIAYYYLGRVHQVVEIEDLLQIGMVGLIEAAHNYQPVSYTHLTLPTKA